MMLRSEYLLERIAAARTAGEPDPWDEDDLQDVGLEVAEFLREALDVAALERQLVGSSQLDVERLRWLVDKLESLASSPSPPFQLRLGGEAPIELEWRDRLRRLTSVVASLETPEQLERAEVLLRLNLAADTATDTLLAALPIDHPFKSELKSALAAKLALMADEDAMKYWTQLRFQVDPSRAVHFAVEADIAPPAFFDLGDADSVRDRIATYLAEVRPALERRTYERGVDRADSGHRDHRDRFIVIARIGIVIAESERSDVFGWFGRRGWSSSRSVATFASGVSPTASCAWVLSI